MKHCDIEILRILELGRDIIFVFVPWRLNIMCLIKHKTRIGFVNTITDTYDTVIIRTQCLLKRHIKLLCKQKGF